MKLKIGGSQLKDNLHHLERWRAGDNPGPLIVEISPTYGCNHDCVHCSYQQYSPYDRYKFLSDSVVLKQFLSEFKSLGGVEVYFAGTGEPMMNSLLTEWIQYGYNIGLNVTLGTNGVLLNSQKMKGILPFVKWIKFSVNGGDRVTYTKVHRCNATDFDRLIRNLENAVQYRDSYNLDVRLVIQFLTSNFNWTSIPSILNIHKNIGTDLLIFRNAIPKDGPLIYSQDIIKTLKEINAEEKVHIRWDTYQQRINNFGWEKCYGINFRTNMDYEGNLFTCFRHCFRNSTYGNIFNERFMNIWNSTRKKKIFSEVEEELDRPDCKKWCQVAYDNVFLRDYLEEREK